MNLGSVKRSTIAHLCIAITFFTSGLIINLIQCVLYVALRPFNKKLYRQINYYLCFSFYSQLLFMAEWWSGTDCTFYVDKDDFEKYYGKEHAYCIMNHTYEIDWIIGWLFCDRIHCLGNVKAYAKKVIQYMPTLGWSWKFSEFVFLERNFEKDKAIIDRQVANLVDHPDPMWLLMFPEGTRFTPAKHKISVDFAKEKNLEPLKHHLLPRTKGFIASLPAIQRKNVALYNIELAFSPKEAPDATVTSLMFGKGVQAHMYFHRIPCDQVPKDEAGQDKFLKDMFVIKDKLRDSFLNTGDFFATSGVKRVPAFKLPRRYHSLINSLVWNLSVQCPLIYHLFKWLYNGDLVYFSICSLLIFAFYVLLKKFIGMSKISQGSSYGTGSPKKEQ